MKPCVNYFPWIKHDKIDPSTTPTNYTSFILDVFLLYNT